MSESNNNKGNLSDLMLWKRFTADIDPLEEPDWQELEKNLEKSEQKQIDKIDIEPVLKPKQRQSVKNSNQPAQLDRKTEDRLKKGKLPIEATLDLHGFTQNQARPEVEKFILQAQQSDKRCVLIVTGKGKTGQTSDDWLAPKPGVLKRVVPEWLSEKPLLDYVLKTYPAKPAHGGDGALYVYLKRNRSIE